ncbi:MAG TPA: oligosaccharide flippase family protein, partial [Methanosarcina sp.]|nr:oligosaccharide flippase family protein [Methanosarcina sp.]
MEKRAGEKVSGSSNRGSFAYDVLTLAGGTTFAQILAIISVPILTRLYGPEDFGVWALYISITSILSVIVCMRYEFSIMLPESDEDAINLLAVCFLAVVVVTNFSLVIIWYSKEFIVEILNSPQIGDYLWLIAPFVFVNGIFLALNNWNSRTKLFKRLSISKVSSSISTIAMQIAFGFIRKNSPWGLITGNLAGQTIATIILGGQIWRDDRHSMRKSLRWREIYKGFKRYRKFPLIETWSA